MFSFFNDLAYSNNSPFSCSYFVLIMSMNSVYASIAYDSTLGFISNYTPMSFLIVFSYYAFLNNPVSSNTLLFSSTPGCIVFTFSLIASNFSGSKSGLYFLTIYS